jgi:hypothetical protein
MPMVAVQEPERATGSPVDLDKLDINYVKFVNCALNGEKFYIDPETGKKYDVLEELGKVGRECIKSGFDERARKISYYFKVRESADNSKFKDVLYDKKDNKFYLRGHNVKSLKRNAGGRLIDGLGNLIDFGSIADYSGELDELLKEKGKYAKFDAKNKGSRSEATKNIYKSSAETKAKNLRLDGLNLVIDKIFGEDGDFEEAEGKFYSAAREYEALAHSTDKADEKLDCKKSSEMLYARALACRMVKEGNYKSALETLKKSGDTLYDEFSNLMDGKKMEVPKDYKNGGVKETFTPKTLDEISGIEPEDVETKVVELAGKKGVWYKGLGKKVDDIVDDYKKRKAYTKRREALYKEHEETMKDIPYKGPSMRINLLNYKPTNDEDLKKILIYREHKETMEKLGSRGPSMRMNLLNSKLTREDHEDIAMIRDVRKYRENVGKIKELERFLENIRRASIERKKGELEAENPGLVTCLFDNSSQ